MKLGGSGPQMVSIFHLHLKKKGKKRKKKEKKEKKKTLPWLYEMKDYYYYLRYILDRYMVCTHWLRQEVDWFWK